MLILAIAIMLTSLLGGMISAGLICARRRRIGVLILALSCAGAALIVATTIATGGGTIAEAGATGAKYALIPLAGAILIYVVVLLARIVWAIVRAIVSILVRSVHAFNTFISEVARDIYQHLAKSADSSKDSRQALSKSSRRGLALIGISLIMLLGLNAKPISDLTARIAPRLSVITNIMDLISFILVTPKLFPVGVKDRLLNVYMHILQIDTLSQVQNSQEYNYKALCRCFR